MITAILILFALAIIVLVLYFKGKRDGAKEPTTGYIRYDTDYPERTKFDPEYLQHCIEKAKPHIKDVEKSVDEMRSDYPYIEFKELTDEAKKERYNDIFKNKEVDDPIEYEDFDRNEHKMLEKEIDKHLKRVALKKKLKKIETDKNIK